MALSVKSPTFLESSFNCPRCGALAAQEWFELFSKQMGVQGSQRLRDKPTVAVSASGEPNLINADWMAARCFACKDHSLWRKGELVYPDPSIAPVGGEHLPHEDMPEDATELFREAVAVLPFSRRAAAALCRASMECLVKFIDPDCPKQTSLDVRLVRLEERMSTSTAQLLNVLRHVGNTALHGARDEDASATIYLDETDGTIAETFFLVINTLVDELITRPRLSKELYGSLPPSVRAAYEAKRGGRGG
ncbi:DUF4145 domain-containing protein [Paenarthrobacter nicotinovorans]|uniref:DUF4145 domain-containing protein n=1 Tax=Paenarthrobacter nicotinovorans TaxID=29320 RepID=A0ABV0GMP4_PAENI